MTHPKSTRNNPIKRSTQGLEALGTPSGKQRRHGSAEARVNVYPQEKQIGGDNTVPQPIARAERRAIQFPYRIERD